MAHRRLLGAPEEQAEDWRRFRASHLRLTQPMKQCPDLGGFLSFKGGSKTQRWGGKKEEEKRKGEWGHAGEYIYIYLFLKVSSAGVKGGWLDDDPRGCKL